MSHADQDLAVRQTCLFPLHQETGGRMIPFAGVMLPLQFQGILAEHDAARHGAALFDTSHMSRFRLRGSGTLNALERLLTCRVGTLAAGRCRYGLMLEDDGGTLDDLVLYRFGDEEFLLVANAGPRQQDWSWICAHLPAGAILDDETETTAKIDLQGPAAPSIAFALMPDLPRDLGYFHFCHTDFQGESILASRTGYTGESGFELYLSHDAARAFWTAAMRHGAVPAGLGARDTLRLEMGMPLYGSELRRDRCAAESGLDRVMATEKDFIGRDAVRDPARRRQQRVGLIGEGKRAARAGDPIRHGSAVVGVVTSGSLAPSLGVPVALAYVNTEAAHPATRLTVEGRRSLPMRVHPLPFYTQGTARAPLHDFLDRSTTAVGPAAHPESRKTE